MALLSGYSINFPTWSSSATYLLIAYIYHLYIHVHWLNPNQQPMQNPSKACCVCECVCLICKTDTVYAPRESNLIVIHSARIRARQSIMNCANRLWLVGKHANWVYREAQHRTHTYRLLHHLGTVCTRHQTNCIYIVFMMNGTAYINYLIRHRPTHGPLCSCSCSCCFQCNANYFGKYKLLESFA